MCYIRIFELCDRLLLNNKIERKRCKRCPASFLQRKYVCQRECMFDISAIMIACYHDNSSDGEKYTKLCTDFWVDIRHSKRKFHYGTFWISIGIRPYRRSAASYLFCSLIRQFLLQQL